MGIGDTGISWDVASGSFARSLRTGTSPFPIAKVMIWVPEGFTYPTTAMIEK